MKVQVGVYAQYYGNVDVEIPDNELTEKTPEAAREWLAEHWDDVPLPSGMSYVSDSADIDEESVQILGDDE